MTPPHVSARQDELVTALNRAVFMRESQQAAVTFQQIISSDPNFSLPLKAQHDLARLLELGNEPNLALQAYEAIIENEDEASEHYKTSLRAAGHLCYRLKSHQKCREYLEQFLMSGVTPPNEKSDAETILRKLPDGKGVRDLTTVQTIDQSVNEISDMAVDLGSEAGLRIDCADSDDSASAIKMPLKQDINNVTTDEDISYLADKANPRLSPQNSPSELKLPPPPPQRASSDNNRVPPPPNDELFISGIDKSDETPATQVYFGKSDPIENPPDPEYSEYGETPPLKMDSRDLRGAKHASTTKISKERPPADRYQPQPHEQKSDDDDGNMFDFGSPSLPPSSGELAAQSSEDHDPDHYYESLQNSEFCLLLPVKAKINIDEVTRFLVATEGLSANDARKAVIERKGCLRRGLTVNEAIELFHQTQRFPKQTFAFVEVSSDFKTDHRIDVSKVEILGPGMRAHTPEGVKKIRWEKIKLMSCGRLNRQPTLDVYVDDSLRHYRLMQGNLDFLMLHPRGDEDFNEAAKEFFREVMKNTPDIPISHTLKNLLNGKAYRPQKFASENEYDQYNQALLLSHYGEEVAMDKLSEAKAASSAW